MAKKTKLKIASLLVAGGMAVAAGIGIHKCSDSYASNETQLKKEISQMSVDQLQDAIAECDTALANLQQVIDSPESNPEKRFEARNAFKSISEHRRLYMEKLSKMNKQKIPTMHFRDTGNVK